MTHTAPTSDTSRQEDHESVQHFLEYIRVRAQTEKLGCCNNCGEYNGLLYRCTGCGTVKYCGLSCQKSHWRQHKHDCHPESVQQSVLVSTSIRQCWSTFVDRFLLILEELVVGTIVANGDLNAIDTSFVQINLDSREDDDGAFNVHGVQKVCMFSLLDCPDELACIAEQAKVERRRTGALVALATVVWPVKHKVYNGKIVERHMVLVVRTRGRPLFDLASLIRRKGASHLPRLSEEQQKRGNIRASFCTEIIRQAIQENIKFPWE